MKINNQDYHGLSTAEVNQRISNGKINTVDNKITKSYKQIFLNNTITFFNILNAALLGLVLFVGSYKNTLFILVIIINTIAGIYQEIKAKRTLDRLSILTTSHVEVIRDDELKEKALALQNVQRQLEGKEVKKIIVVKGKVVNIVAK